LFENPELERFEPATENGSWLVWVSFGVQTNDILDRLKPVIR